MGEEQEYLAIKELADHVGNERWVALKSVMPIRTINR